MKSKKKATFYVHEWLEKADVDYFSAFVKAYIPFNAWLNDHYSGLNSDREKINAVKTTQNTFHDKLESLLQLKDSEGETFRGQLGELHDALERSALVNNGEKITFTDVSFGRNPIPKVDQTIRGVAYHAHYDDSRKETILSIHSRVGKTISIMSFPEYPSEDEVCANAGFAKLSQSQKDVLLGMYRQANPFRRGSLLQEGKIMKGKDVIKFGSYTMIKDVGQLSAGVIEVLYTMRNALFHGIINPTHDANRAYGAAYHVLRTLIASLV